MFGILNMSGQIGNVKHGDIFIPCKFIAHSKIKVIKECDRYFTMQLPQRLCNTTDIVRSLSAERCFISK